MYIECVELVVADPTNLAGLIGGMSGPADRAGTETDVELLANLAIAIGDHVPRVAVDADQSRDFDTDAGFLDHLTSHRLGDGLSGLHDASGQSPQSAVAPPVEQNAPIVIYDHS
jgi:hypothetical protein